MRRKTYLLLELLIAFTLLSLCALPLVRNPMHAAKEELLAFERIELERLSELAFASLLEKFYCNEIPWDTFASSNLPNVPLYQEKFTLSVSNIIKKPYKKNIFIWTKAQKEGPEKESVRLVYIKIVFNSNGGEKKEEKAFIYRVLLEKKKNSSSSIYRK